MKRFFTNIFIKIVAALFLFLGFGMIHGASQVVEKTGSIFIGIGAFYFIILLLTTQLKK